MGRGGVFSDVLGLLTGPRAQSSGLGARCWGGASVREKGWLCAVRVCGADGGGPHASNTDWVWLARNALLN